MKKQMLVFATNNEHKLAEARQILENQYDIVSLKDIGCTEDIPETADTLQGNALLKARFVYEKYGAGCFSDDTGLEIAALGGAPGVFSARYAGEGKNAQDNMHKVLAEMQNESNRKAQFRTVIALVSGTETHLFEGKIEGEILCEPQGEAGFGYDPIFQPNGYTETFAQMPVEEKNKISHRGQAMEKLINFLNRAKI